MNPEEQIQKIIHNLIRRGIKLILITNITASYKGNTGEIGKILNEYIQKNWIELIDDTSFTIKDELLLRICPDLYFGENLMKNYSLEEKKEARLKILKSIYDTSGGSLSSMIDIWSIGKNLNFEYDLTKITYDYLIEKKYLKSMALGGKVSLTLLGIESIENSKENPSKAIGDFPSFNITFNQSTFTNSGVQIGNTNSQQTIIYNDSQILDWLNNLQSKIKELSISDVNQIKLEEEINEVKNLLKTEETKKSKYLKLAWENIKSILQSATGSAVFEVLSNMPTLPF